MGLIANYRSNSAYEAVAGSLQRAENIIAVAESARLDKEDWEQKLLDLAAKIRSIVSSNPDMSTWTGTQEKTLLAYFESVYGTYYAKVNYGYAIRLFNKMQKLYDSVLNRGLGKNDARQRLRAYDEELKQIMVQDFARALLLSSFGDQLQNEVEPSAFDVKKALKETNKLLRTPQYKFLRNKVVDYEEILSFIPLEDTSTFISYVENLQPSIEAEPLK